MLLPFRRSLGLLSLSGRWSGFFAAEQLDHGHIEKRNEEDGQEGGGGHPAQNARADGSLGAGAGPAGNGQGQDAEAKGPGRS